MDLAGMINDGAEALHRGSVDKTGSAPNTPALGSRASDPAISTTSNESAHSFKENRSVDSGELRQQTQHQQTQQNQTQQNHDQPEKNHDQPEKSQDQHENSKNSDHKIPRWAQIYKGRHNKVRDPKRWKLAETRPELTDMFDEEQAENPQTHQTVITKVEESQLPSAHLPPSTFRAYPVPATSASDIGPGGNFSLTRLSASMAGLIPNDDQTKVLAGWLFEKIEQIHDREQLRNIEVEFKMGTIADDNDLRHRFPTLSEAVIDPVYWRQQNLKFKTAINERSFRSLETLCDSIEVANAANERNTVFKSNQLVTDEVYQVKCDSINPAGMTRVRVSKDDRGRVVECIHKQRIGDLFLSLPNTPFDLKMSMSLETPVDFETIVAPQIVGVSSSFERNKNRLKWASRGCTVDLTSVHTKVIGGMPPQVIKEGEIEANMELLGSVLQELRDGRNKEESLDKFLEIVRYTLDSARFLLRNL